MSARNFKIDKFYIIMAAVLTIEAVFVILTFRTIFGVMETIYQIDEKVPDKELKINTERLDKSFDLITQREIPSLLATPSAEVVENTTPTPANETPIPTIQPNQ